MNILFFILCNLSLITIGVFLVMAAYQFVKKDKVKGKKQLRNTGIAAIVAVASFVMFVATSDSINDKGEVVTTTADTDSVEEKVDEKPKETEEERKARYEKEAQEKLADEQKAKEEAEARAKVKAEEEARVAAEEKAKQEKILAEAKIKKANAKAIDYAQLKKNPDRHKGEYVKYTGEIVQILEGSGVTNIRLAVTKSSYGYNVGDVIFVEYAGYTDFVDNDIVTVYGTIYGAYSYKSQAGFDISLPGLLAETIE